MEKRINDTIKLRKGGLSDAPYLAGLEKVIFPEEPWPAESFEGEFSGLNETIYLLLVDEAANPEIFPGGIIGYAGIWIILNEGHITNIGIHPSYRRLGLGEYLVKELLKQAEEKGVESETLEVRISNTPAITLYEKLGFSLAGKRRGYYSSNHEDALIYWRKK